MNRDDPGGTTAGAHRTANIPEPPSLARAQHLRAAGRPEEALLAYEAVLESRPTQPEALLGTAALLMASGQEIARAQMLLVRCCGIAPDRAEAWDALGVALVLGGEFDTAETAFAEAQRLAPDVIDYAMHRAEAALAAGNAEPELARLAVALERDPLDVASLTANALLLDHLGRRDEAADLLETAVSLQPDALPPLALLGRVLASLNRPSQAEAVLARVVALDPDNPKPRNDRAVMLLRVLRAVEAREILQDLVAAGDAPATVLCNLANAHAVLGEQEEAARTARAAIALSPADGRSWRALCNVLPYCEGVGGAALLSALRACSDHLARGPAPVWPNAPDPARRLRIGLLSGSLKVHPVGWLTVAGFENLPPGGFEIVCLSQVGANDALARRFRSLAAEWHEIGTLDDTALAAFARSRAIDILIDLGGYGEAGRLPACALRLAPVQVKWVGMQNHSTGLPEIDWFVTDAWETPPGFERFYAERLLRLPDGYVCYSPPVDAPEVTALPMRTGAGPTFGCFNNLAKITPTVIVTWSAILRALPSARLVVKCHPFADEPTRAGFRAAFAAQGVSADRLELQGAAPHRAFLAEYGRIDIALDPFPYTGGLTTCEALWMGVPVVTLPGESFASRHSTSHLHNVGLGDWVAPDREGYVALAIAKAADPAALGALRAGLRERMRASPLCDGPRFGRNLGAALRQVWRGWCVEAGQPATAVRIA